MIDRIKKLPNSVRSLTIGEMLTFLGICAAFALGIWLYWGSQPSPRSRDMFQNPQPRRIFQNPDGFK